MSSSASAAAPAALPTVTGRLADKSDDRIVLSLPGTDYRLHLVPRGSLEAQVGQRVTGVIRVKAKRVDVVPSGGRYIEPVFGRPRRVQGRVIGGDVQTNTLHVHAAAPVIAQLMPSQKAANFAVGQLVSFDVERGATFELEQTDTQA
ncbi:MAG TPA: hypothetical protein VF184_12445 [Phycisphaeraceae bacterium]